MPVITIRGQMGSGASEIGKEVSRLLKADYVDREILESVAQLVGRPVAQIEEKEQIPVRLVRRILAVFERAEEKSGTAESAYRRTWEEPLENAKYLFALESVIQDLALEENIVLVGRGSQFILRNHPSALHVLVIAPLLKRIKEVAAALDVPQQQARKQIEESDKSRRVFIQRFFKRALENPDYYDLVVNTERLAYDAAASIIVSAAAEKLARHRL